MNMKLDEDFQNKFFTYLNNLSKEEIINIIKKPTVNVNFLTNIEDEAHKLKWNKRMDLYKVLK